MARIILAAIAALCALAAASAVSILGEAPQLQLSEQQQQHQQLLLAADLDLIRSSPGNTLEAIEQALQVLRAKIQQTSDDAEAAVKSALQSVEDNARQLGDKWNARVQEWVNNAKQNRVDVRDCVNGQTSALTEVAKAFTTNFEQCLVLPINDIYQDLQEIGATALEINATVGRVNAELESCRKQGGVLEQTVCQVTQGGVFITEVVQLSTKVSSRVAQIANKVSTLQTSVTTCTAKVFADALPQGSLIVDATIRCIKDKLNP